MADVLPPIYYENRRMLGTTVDIWFRTGSQGFAQTASYFATSGSGTGTVIPILFDNEGTLTFMGNVAVQNNTPMMYVRTSDIPATTKTSIMVVSGSVYSIVKQTDDLSGVSMLEVSRDKRNT